MFSDIKRLIMLLVAGVVLFIGAIFSIHVHSYIIGGICAFPLGFVLVALKNEYSESVVSALSMPPLTSVHKHGYFRRDDLRDPHISWDFWYSPELAQKAGITEEKINDVCQHGGMIALSEILHRTDGPAHVLPEGQYEYYIAGQKLTKEEFLQQTESVDE